MFCPGKHVLPNTAASQNMPPRHLPPMTGSMILLIQRTFIITNLKKSICLQNVNFCALTNVRMLKIKCFLGSAKLRKMTVTNFLNFNWDFRSGLQHWNIWNINCRVNKHSICRVPLICVTKS